MHVMKIMLLFGFVLFSAYAQYDAEKTISASFEVKKINMDNQPDSGEKDIEFMKRAIQLSYLAHSHSDGPPFGSVVVRNGIIIGEGWNKVDRLKDPSAHAEVLAIREASKYTSAADLKGSILYASAQPCAMCLSLIYLAGIEKVYYCIPRNLVSGIAEDLSASHFEEALRSYASARPLTEIPILQDSVAGVLARYKRGRK
jgi:guanine deaminase